MYIQIFEVKDSEIVKFNLPINVLNENCAKTLMQDMKNRTHVGRCFVYEQISEREYAKSFLTNPFLNLPVRKNVVNIKP